MLGTGAISVLMVINLSFRDLYHTRAYFFLQQTPPYLTFTIMTNFLRLSSKFTKKPLYFRSKGRNKLKVSLSCFFQKSTWLFAPPHGHGEG